MMVVLMMVGMVMVIQKLNDNDNLCVVIVIVVLFLLFLSLFRLTSLSSMWSNLSAAANTPSPIILLFPEKISFSLLISSHHTVVS